LSDAHEKCECHGLNYQLFLYFLKVIGGREGESHYIIYSADKRPRFNLISPKCYTKPLGGKMGYVKAIINLCLVVICYGHAYWTGGQIQ
jgi:hypothetical protein